MQNMLEIGINNNNNKLQIGNTKFRYCFHIFFYFFVGSTDDN